MKNYILLMLILVSFSCSDDFETVQPESNTSTPNPASVNQPQARFTCETLLTPVPTELRSKQPSAIGQFPLPGSNCYFQSIPGEGGMSFLASGPLFPFDGHTYKRSDFPNGRMGVTTVEGSPLYYQQYVATLFRKENNRFIKLVLDNFIIPASCIEPNCPPAPSQYLPDLLSFSVIPGKYRLVISNVNDATDTPILESTFFIE